MRRGGWITGVGCMVPFIAAGLWMGLQLEVPECVSAAVNRVIERDRLYPVLVNGKVGYINRSGKLVVPARYEPTGRIGIDAVTCPTINPAVSCWENRRVTWGRDFHDGRAAVRTGRGWQIIDGAGRELLARPAEQARDYSGGSGAVKTSKGWQIIDTSGRELLARPVDDLGESQYGLRWFKASGKYGLVDEDGNIRIPAELVAVPKFIGEVWCLSYGGYWGIADTQGRRLTKEK